MKKAFTLLELIFVIIVIGILAAVVLPKLGTNSLMYATTVFIDTLRYTQHLAMVDDKYIPSQELSPYNNPIKKSKDTKYWFKKWWTFYINGQDSSPFHPVLVVFSDIPSKEGETVGFNCYPYYKEVASEGTGNKKFMGRAFNGPTDLKYVDKSLDLLTSYGIKKVLVDTPCSHNKTKLAFDELGRPHCVQNKRSTNATPYKNILDTRIKYTLCKDDECEENSSVCVAARSGYIYQCD